MNAAARFLLVLLVLILPVGLLRAQEPAAAPGATVSVPAADLMGGASMLESCADCGCAGGGWAAGVGLYWMQPYFENNLAYAVGQTNAGPPVSLTVGRVDVSHHMEVAPLVWLGYVSDCGWGARARWWYFRQGTSQTEPAGTAGATLTSAAPLGLSLTGGGAALNVTTKLELQAADLEATQDYRVGSWDFLLAAGVRLARVTQSYNAYFDRGGLNELLSGHGFQGVGPTLALEARRPFGASGLALIGNARGSVVFGSARQRAEVPDLNSIATDHRNRGLPIAELELGLEYARTIGAGRVFGQVGFVGQDWFGAGGASRSSLNVAPGGAVNGAAYVGDSDISLLGVSFRLGLDY